jgi:hypothetical protein
MVIIGGGSWVKDHILRRYFRPCVSLNALRWQRCGSVPECGRVPSPTRLQMNVQIGGGAKTLDERDSSRVGFATFEPRLLDKKVRNDAVDDLQYRREQLRMGGEEDAQRDRDRERDDPGEVTHTRVVEGQRTRKKIVTTVEIR